MKVCTQPGRYGGRYPTRTIWRYVHNPDDMEVGTDDGAGLGRNSDFFGSLKKV